MIRRLVIPLMATTALVMAACGPQQATPAASAAATAATTAGALPAQQTPQPGGELIYIVTAEHFQNDIFRADPIW